MHTHVCGSSLNTPVVCKHSSSGQVGRHPPAGHRLVWVFNSPGPAAYVVWEWCVVSATGSEAGHRQMPFTIITLYGISMPWCSGSTACSAWTERATMPRGTSRAPKHTLEIFAVHCLEQRVKHAMQCEGAGARQSGSSHGAAVGNARQHGIPGAARSGLQKRRPRRHRQIWQEGQGPLIVAQSRTARMSTFCEIPVTLSEHLGCRTWPQEAHMHAPYCIQ